MDTTHAFRVSVAGASGYSGGELVRLLARHPRVKLGLLAAGEQQGRSMSEAMPNLRGIADQELVATDFARLGRDSDLVFLALPHGMAFEAAPALLAAGARVIDIGADFRLRDPAVYRRHYQLEHRCPELLAEAVYGLPELYREQLEGARLVANPGCYPTATALAAYPLLRAFGPRIERTIVVDAKSGVSGAGRKAALASQFSEVNENVRPFGTGEHRHAPEMEPTLRRCGHDTRVFFSPHLVPMTRGILAAVYLRMEDPPTQEQAQEVLEQAYAGEPFVRVLRGLPETKATWGSNYCDLAVRRWWSAGSPRARA